MRISPTFRLHFVVFLWGYTGIIGKLILLDAIPLVWYRVFIAVSTIGIYMYFKKISFHIHLKELVYFLFLGGLIAIHWCFFFLSIKVSNVSIAVCTLSTGALFTSLLEPLFFKRKMDFYEIALGVVVIVCMAVLFKIAPKYYLGIIYGILCTLLSVLFSILNALLIKRNKHSAIEITFYELIGAFILLSLIIIVNQNFTDIIKISPNDFYWLLILGIILTAYPMIESIGLMKYISPYTMLLTINLEPVYGIILAYFIFPESEKMTPLFYIVVLVLVGSIILNELLKRNKISKILIKKN